MKFLSLLALSLPLVAFAQTQISIQAPDVQSLWDRAAWHEAETGKTYIGEIIETDVDFFQAATLTELPDGGVQWQLDLRIPGAPALAVYFDAFHLPVGSELTFSSPEGAFPGVYQDALVDASENNEHGLFVSGEVPGEVVRMTYREAPGTIGQPQLHVNGLGYFIRYLWLPEAFDLVGDGGDRGSDFCEVDVNCPEGADWVCQRDAVVRLRVSMGGGIFYCSGSMVNNTARDCRQLLLSSFHCADDMSDSDWALMKVRYNYEYLECGGTVSLNSHDRTGVMFLTSSDDMVGSNITGSDFLLVEVEDPIFESWTPYLAGWDATGIPAQEGVGIHHPSGDRKKISTTFDPVSSSSAYAPGAHWRVSWDATETDHGVTEGGSSGSPLFDQNKRIIGTLTGGSSFCTSPSSPDYYGKLSYHWDGPNPIPAAEKLQAFLDPAGTGEEVLDGTYIGDGTSCEPEDFCTALSVENTLLTSTAWQLYPNPATDVVRIQWPAQLHVVELRIYDAQGRRVQVLSQANGINEFSVSGWSSGLYYVTARSASGASGTQSLQVR